jgi:steroid 5-alpha reductase family enzyme
MVLDGLIGNAAILLGVVLILWVVSLQIKDVSFIDSVWGGAMALLALVSWLRVAEPGALATLIAAMTIVWGVRLAVHLLRRWRREGEDPRYARMLRKPREQGRFAVAALTRVFLGQAVLLFVVSSPAQVGILAAASEQPISGLALVGLALWLVGVFFEWVGDCQLARFRADPASKGQVMDTGLWRYTRHPNYFGDACAWWGIWLAAASAGWWVAPWTLPGPLFLTFTLTWWSGKPLLEAGLAKRRPGYADYVRRTSGFFPLPPRRR